MSGTPVDYDEVRKRFALVCESAVAAADHLFHRPEVVVTNKTFDLEAAVALAVWIAVFEGHHRDDTEAARDV